MKRTTNQDDFYFLIQHLYEVIQSNVGEIFIDDGIWLADGEILGIKYFAQTASIADLLEGTKPQININVKLNFLDHQSIYSIARSCLETYLTFNYIFVDTKKSSGEKQLRYQVWTLSSYLNRQRFSKFSKLMEETLHKEMEDISQMKEDIKESPHFTENNLGKSVVKDIINDKKRIDWKNDGGWRMLAENAGYETDFFDDCYNLLSSVSHADQVVIHHMRNDNQKEVQRGMISTVLSIVNIVTADFIHDFASLYPKSQKYLESNHELLNMIEILRKLHSESYKKIRL